MSYYFSKGSGILTEINVKETLIKKLDVDFRPYKILSTCNSPFTHKALEAENKIGTMLPCNVIVQQLEDGVEVATVDLVASMMADKNDQLGEVASTIQSKLKSVIEGL